MSLLSRPEYWVWRPHWKVFSKKYNGSYLVNYRYSTLQLLGYIGLKIAGNVLQNTRISVLNFYLPTKTHRQLYGLGYWRFKRAWRSSST